MGFIFGFIGALLLDRRGGVSPPAIRKNLILSSIFTDFGRGDPSPTIERFTPITPNQKNRPVAEPHRHGSVQSYSVGFCQFL